jgi:hypothetical protein
MFLDIVKILHLRINLLDSIKQPSVLNQKIYKRSDFTPEVLEIALKNIRLGCVDNFLSNFRSEREKFPIIRRISL